MLILTALTLVTNIFNLEDYTEIILNYWLSIYPIAYYFIGCYIKKFKFRIRKK